MKPKRPPGKPAPAAEPLSAEMQRTLDDALTAHQEGRVQSAIEGYHIVLAVAPHQIDALVNLGSALTELGKAGEAAALLRRAREAAPKLPRVHNDVGVCFAELGRHEDAIAAYQTAVTLAPGYSVAWANLGRALIDAGRKEEAAAALQRAVLLEPLLAAGWLDLGRALFDDKNPGAAIDALTRAVASDPELQWARFELGVALDVAGDRRAAKQQFAMLPAESARIGKAVESWEYVKSNRAAGTRLLVTTRDVLLHALSQARGDGLNVELGVRYGVTARMIAAADPGRALHGFDSFHGLPEDWHLQPKGIYSTFGEEPEVPGNVELYVGLFEETLGPFAHQNEGSIRFMNVDCDLYSATKTALDALGDKIAPGTVLVFAEYLLNEQWREDEYKAFQEAAAQRGWRYEYLAFSLWTGQAAVRILP